MEAKGRVQVLSVIGNDTVLLGIDPQISELVLEIAITADEMIVERGLPACRQAGQENLGCG